MEITGIKQSWWYRILVVAYVFYWVIAVGVGWSISDSYYGSSQAWEAVKFIFWALVVSEILKAAFYYILTSKVYLFGKHITLKFGRPQKEAHVLDEKSHGAHSKKIHLTKEECERINKRNRTMGLLWLILPPSTLVAILMAYAIATFVLTKLSEASY